jgi:hypothetical protein
MDYNGGDFDIKNPDKASSVMECGELCEMRKDCVAWTYDPTNNNCWLKNKKVYLKNNSNSIAGSCEPE